MVVLFEHLTISYTILVWLHLHAHYTVRLASKIVTVCRTVLRTSRMVAVILWRSYTQMYSYGYSQNKLLSVECYHLCYYFKFLMVSRGYDVVWCFVTKKQHAYILNIIIYLKLRLQHLKFRNIAFYFFVDFYWLKHFITIVAFFN